MRSSPGPPVESGRPHVWLVDVDEEAFLALGEVDGPGEPLWSAVERARAARLSDPAARRRLLARRAALRIVLAGYLECGPADVRIVAAPGGKPVLLPSRTPAPAFSVGHSGSLFCVAISDARSVGCDVEVRRPVAKARQIAERWFGAEEARDLTTLAGGLDEAFLDLWTCKEALAKRHGAGLRLMMGQSAEPAVRRELDVAAERTAGRLRTFDPGEGYTGAIAATEPITEVRLVRPGADTWTI